MDHLRAAGFTAAGRLHGTHSCDVPATALVKLERRDFCQAGPGPDLSAEERGEIKKVAHVLPERLKTLLVFVKSA